MLNTKKMIIGGLALIAIASTTTAAESIAYRLSDMKEMHFDDGRKAEQHLAAVKRLGCEASMDSHGDHTDILYRSEKWQVMEVATEKLAHQWEEWLMKSGFETVHGHASDHGTGQNAQDGRDHAEHSHDGHNHDPGTAEEVSYVLPNWKTIHAQDAAQMSELVALMKGLGCEVRTEDHGGHKDVSVRCPQWKHIEVASHQAATNWQAWLQKNGFETRHED